MPCLDASAHAPPSLSCGTKLETIITNCRSEFHDLLTCCVKEYCTMLPSLHSELTIH